MDKEGHILPVGEVWKPDVTDNVTDVTDNVTDNVIDTSTADKRREEMLRLMKLDKKITTENLANILHVSRMTISRDINLLRSRNRLTRDGDDIVAKVDGKVVYQGKKKSTQMHGVYCNSTLDEKTNTLYTKVVNLCSTGTQGTLNLANGTAEKAEMVRLAGMSGEDENTMQYPNNIVPRPAKVQIAKEGKQLTFPVAPFSVNIITTKLK